MIERSLDANGDWTFGRGKSNYLTMNRAIGQSIQTRLSSFLGDCFFDTAAGIDWFNFLGSKQKVALQLAIRAVIINTQGVTRLTLLSLTYTAARKISFSYEVETIYTGVLAPSGTVTNSGDFILTEDGFKIITEDGNPLVT